MKKTVYYLLFFVLGCSNVTWAQDVINYFEVGDEIATPVTIHTSKGEFTIVGGEMIEGNLYGITAYDVFGNKILENTPYKTDIKTGQPTIRYYSFRSLYPSSEEASEEIEEYENSQNSYKNNNYGLDGGSWGTQLGNNMNNAVDRAIIIPMRGYPNLQVRTGYSIQFGEIIGLKAQLGGMGGYNLAGGIGKNLFNNNQDDLSWYAEVGWYGGDEYNDVSFDVILGNNFNSDLLLAALLEYSYYFDIGRSPRLGVYVSGQYGLFVGQRMTSFSSFIYNAAWDFKIGLTYKLFSN